jgi:hypothetical protein
VFNLISPSLSSYFNNDGKLNLSWDKKNQEYNQGNNKISDRKLYKIVRSQVDIYEQKFEKLTTRFVNGNISFEDWQKRMVEQTKKAHVNMARLGRGGKDNTFANHYLQVGTDLRKVHYPALRQFSKDIAEGKLTEKQIINRAKLYGSATKNSFEKGRISLFSEDLKARRRLGACKNHCAECIAYAKEGWKNLKDIVPPGEKCTCKMNCCCSIEIIKK